MNNNDKNYNLLDITVGGFQVFDEPTTIPIRGLTFLFGPNSAGKSAIEDAIKIACELFSFQNGSWLTHIKADRLECHWRRLNESKELEAYAETMTLGITIRRMTGSPFLSQIERPTLPESNVDTTGYGESSEVETIGFLATFRRNLKPNSDIEIAMSHDTTILINKVPILKFTNLDTECIYDIASELEINFNHPCWNFYELETDFAALALKYPQLIRHLNRKVSIGLTGEDGYVNSATYRVVRELLNGQLISYIEESRDSWDYHDTSSVPSDLKAALTEIRMFYNILHMYTGRSLGLPSVVEASRGIPTTRDLTFFCGPEEEEFAPMIKEFPLESTGNPRYLKLTSTTKNENHMLSEHLFVERGYQLACDHRVIISPSDHDNLDDALKYGEHLYHIHLVDAQKRAFEFDEVGSGLGYVLPILCVACDQNTPISILQQPELHLHPALQSGLGDVFIECLSIEIENLMRDDCSRQLIIETHSEHILLRVLKRIRQTNSERLPALELQLKAEDVSVLYFDPSPDGTTKIKHLRISDDGEFIDRWPRGFFTEREQDLFDE